ncbi:MAG: hypothetical protein JWN32_3067 [Solirubrobacterales bacterium]|nr:hypothetical protein [Solirubrobacterales bacterium]
MEHRDPDLGPIVATLRAFLVQTEALRVVLLLDRGDAEPLVVDCDAAGALEIADGEVIRSLEPGAFAADAPLPLPDVHRLPPVEVDPDVGQITAPLGTLERTATGVRATAHLFGGRSVFTAAFQTNDPDAPLFIAARGEEPLVISLGAREWELPE